MKRLNIVQAVVANYYKDTEVRLVIMELEFSNDSLTFIGSLLGFEYLNKTIHLHLAFLCLTISLPFKSQ